MTITSPAWNRGARHGATCAALCETLVVPVDELLGEVALKAPFDFDNGIAVHELVDDFQQDNLLDWQRLSVRCGEHTGLMWHVTRRFAMRLAEQIEVIQDLVLTENSTELAVHAMRLCSDATSVAAGSVAATARRIALAASVSNYARMNELVRRLRELSLEFELLGVPTPRGLSRT